jgi:adenosylcobinamide-GDP ribazoletransferase
VIRRFLGALQFLTLLPIHAETTTPAEAAVFFPLVGALLGACGGFVLYALERFLGQSIAALISVGFLIAATGALHEDGLADVADAFRAGRSRERILEILKDSRIGTYGGIALVFSIAIRWQCLAESRFNNINAPYRELLALMAALAISRASLVVLAATTTSVGEGLGSAFTSALTKSTLVAVVIQTVSFALLGGIRGGAMLVTSAFVIAVLRMYFIKRLGGVNGDCLGATSQAVELVNFAILAWRPSI